MGCLTNKDKEDGKTIIAKNDEVTIYLYPGCICLSVVRNTFFVDGDKSNVVVTYNFWQKHKRTAVSPNNQDVSG